MSERITRHLRVRGRVQGVGFRWSMGREAERLGVAGWVRNLRDGSVEAVVQGPARSVEAITAWARHGPAGAQVTDLQAAEAAGEYAGFETRPNA